ncbi:hypothetical protein K491DRAFT_723609 [Lophiostoma macrostomum CBS 122681]|uniref:Transcriptional coactivator p15 (PC4) C-terminal domain-containing protein n=1 Tax=Lophiostoma macrostomum CBS 122681 TaxID=1314788 RepID=A0A6A6SIN3_9PLEO|nr:hypothetical protein K491DRAFT_723609 [Lophiostoma macrostomum CBS 122681]
MAGPRGGFKRGGSRGNSRGGGYSKKRSSPDHDDDSGPRSSKKAKADEDEEEDALPLVPEIRKDGKGEEYIPLNAKGLRRVNVTEFKGKHLVNIREYWTNDAGDVLPGKKGISLNIEQYNALVAALPLLESILTKKGETSVRPDYDGEAPASAEADDDVDEDDEEDAKPSAKDDDDDEEEEE